MLNQPLNTAGDEIVSDQLYDALETVDKSLGAIAIIKTVLRAHNNGELKPGNSSIHGLEDLADQLLKDTETVREAIENATQRN